MKKPGGGPTVARTYWMTDRRQKAGARLCRGWGKALAGHGGPAPKTGGLKSQRFSRPWPGLCLGHRGSINPGGIYATKIKGQKGFTLIEMLIVVVILMILMGVAGMSASNQAAKRWRVKRAIMTLHDLRRAYHTLSRSCGVASVHSDQTNTTNHFKDLLCNNSSNPGLKKWPTGHQCLSSPPKGLQDFLRQSILDTSGGCTSGAAFVADNELDQIFNVDEVEAACAPPGCPTGIGSWCPFAAGQGFTVQTNPTAPGSGGTGAQQRDRLAPPRAVFCGVVAVRTGYRVAVLMDRSGTATVGADGSALTNPCNKGAWCLQDIDGVSTMGCCADTGYAY